jgi:putative radical SAM enzyme (TIGR03279 family)
MFLLAYDGHSVDDLLDYQHMNGLERFVLTVKGLYGETRDVVVEKDADADLGLVPDDGLAPVVCKNKCLFCFVDQLPAGLRGTLYVKDDDYRLSLIAGNYVTLTNLSPADVDKIKRLHISPLYVSVHAADPAVRARLLGRPHCDILPLLRDLHAHGICFHAQAVIVPGVNDGDVLQRTMEALYPLCESLAVVPVGLTRHCNACIKPVGKTEARAALTQIHNFQKAALAVRGSRFVFGADELYVRAELPLPPADAYEEYPQIDNGVGLVTQFRQSFDAALSAHGAVRRPKKRRLTLITGTDFAPFLQSICDNVLKPRGIDAEVVAVVNRFFGESVTVAGLVVGQDIVAQAPHGRPLYVVPRSMLRAADDVFLDDMTLKQLSRQLGGRVIAVPPTGEGLVNLIMDH